MVSVAVTLAASSVSPRVFISYRREDTAYAAAWLFDRLTSHLGRSQIFMDVDSIEIGDDFFDAITTAIASCDVLLALIGGQWLTVTGTDGQRRINNPADVVRLEIEAALEYGLRVIPVLVRPARMPNLEELPVSLAQLARRHALELSAPSFDADVRWLVRSLDLPRSRGGSQLSNGCSSAGDRPERIVGLANLKGGDQL